MRKPKPVTSKKRLGMFARFRLSLEQRLTHSPEKRLRYQQQLEKVQQELKKAEKAA